MKAEESHHDNYQQNSFFFYCFLLEDSLDVLIKQITIQFDFHLNKQRFYNEIGTILTHLYFSPPCFGGKYLLFTLKNG